MKKDFKYYHPFLQCAMMFLGECFCLIIWYIYRRKDGGQEYKKSEVNQVCCTSFIWSLGHLLLSYWFDSGLSQCRLNDEELFDNDDRHFLVYILGSQIVSIPHGFNRHNFCFFIHGVTSNIRRSKGRRHPRNIDDGFNPAHSSRFFHLLQTPCRGENASKLLNWPILLGRRRRVLGSFDVYTDTRHSR